MSIAVDQSRLRRIVEDVLPGGTLERAEAVTIVEIGQLAEGLAPNNPVEHATLQAIAQHVYAIVGLKPEELLPIAPLPDDEARSAWLARLGDSLKSRGARELAFVVAFLVAVSDLTLSRTEVTGLDEFQRALGVDDSRATDLVILASETVASAA